MKNILVVYKSETGFTEKYAKYLSSELSCDAIELKDASIDKISSYDILIYGGGTYAGQINGLKEFKAMVSNEKKLVVFATGATAICETDTIQGIFDGNLTKEEQEIIPHFYAVSGLNYDKMNLKHKVMMKGLLLVMKKKDPQVYETICKSFDACDFGYLDGLLECVKTMVG
ncbi:MAG: flavodoxin domain-containing protein [Intestinibacter sp.]